MKKSKLWTGMTSLFSFFLTAVILLLNCMMGYVGTINQALGIETSKVVNEANAADTMYYASEYGELNAENLQTLIQDTYDESVLEQEEGTVLLRNENHALPLSNSETRITLFGHAVAQPLYKNASAGSNGYKGEHCIDLYSEIANIIATAGYTVAVFRLLTNSVGSLVDAFQGINMFGDATQVGTIMRMAGVMAVSVLLSIIASFMKHVRES